MKISSKFNIFITGIICNVFILSAIEPYQDTTLTVDERVENLISQMTLPEKISQLGHKSSAISRLGISSYNYWNEAIHGVARSGLATSFPVSIALSSTWDPELIFQVASVISDEARIKNNTEGKGLTYWSPTVNMARDPRWGRSEENYGEDVYLASKIAVNFIKGMQGNDPKYLKTVATVKHFACNNVETNRYGISSNTDERDLREYYLPVFKACVTEGRVYSVMSSYNAVNGVPSPANRTLLTNILRNEWGFNGYVVSDCDAVGNVWDSHHYVATAPQATAISIRNGNDLNCGTTFPNNAQAAINSGILTEKDIDEALKKVFKARFLLGEFDPATSVRYKSIPSNRLDCQANRDLALRAAREAMVLLKNENSFLPLNKDSIKTIAVIGPNANATQLGGYSGTPSAPVSSLQGIADKLGVNISNGIIEAENYSIQSGIKTETCNDGGSNIGYIENGDYTVYDSIDFNIGKEKLDIRVASNTSGGYIEVVLDNINGQSLGKFTIPGTGGWQTWKTFTFTISKISGKHAVYLKFTGNSGYLFNLNWFRFYNDGDVDPTAGGGVISYAPGCSVNGSKIQAEFDKAITFAGNSDVAIVVCGTDLSIADESNDRSSLNLPGIQEQLIKEVFRANPKTIVVLVTGASLAVNWAQDSVPAILCAWYNGQAQGTSLADVLFGDYNPGGKLSTTWYKSLSDLPSMNDYNIMNNRTYMYFKGIPLYPFGFGLSYTSFNYSNLKISSNNLNDGGSIVISADITNTGQLAGDEVSQLYVHANSFTLVRPIKELKGFERINIKPGATKTVNFLLKHEDLQYYDVASKTFRVESGKVDIYIGSSSDDIMLDSVISISGGEISSTYRQNPFSIFEAENFENKSATVRNKACAEGGLCIDSLVNNSYVVYKNFNFNEEAKQFNVRLASTDANRSIEIVLDSINGTIAGRLTILPTADMNTYEDQSCGLTGITGVRDVYLVFKGGTSYRCKLNWFSFQDSLTSAEDVITPAKNAGFQCNLFPNPSNSIFTLSYNLPFASAVKTEIYSMQGILLKSVLQMKQTEGMHQLELDTNSSQLKSGAYIVRFKADSFNTSLLLNIIE